MDVWLSPILKIIFGLVSLIAGGELLVRGASRLAAAMKISPLVIGLTVVAFGTSSPELAVSVQSAWAGNADIALGNVVGSNLFNILCVLGLSGAIAPSGVAISPEALRFDIPVMIAVALGCLPIFFTGNVIARWEGGLFFAYYIAYTTYLVLAVTQATITRTFGTIMIGFVIPLTVITLFIGVFRAARDRAKKPNTAPDRVN
jgi:cation:H+ antiporter